MNSSNSMGFGLYCKMMKEPKLLLSNFLTSHMSAGKTFIVWLRSVELYEARAALSMRSGKI